MRHGRITLTTGIAALVAVAACSGKSTPVQASDDLRRDLQLAASQQGIELVPNASRTTVVSAIEQTGVAEPAPAPTKTRAPVAGPRPRRVAPQARVMRAPAPTPQRQVQRPAPRPTFDANVISPPPPGGYKTVDEVIRNAPFPIKP
ncbi:MAG: hypothetical protein ABR499_13340 [Gemmatimonadaceae bacterium]